MSIVSLVVVGLAFTLFVCAALAALMVGAEYDKEFEREPDAHASLADDMHLAKVSRMANAMKADREAALNRIGGSD